MQIWFCVVLKSTFDLAWSLDTHSWKKKSQSVWVMTFFVRCVKVLCIHQLHKVDQFKMSKASLRAVIFFGMGGGHIFVKAKIGVQCVAIQILKIQNLKFVCASHFWCFKKDEMEKAIIKILTSIDQRGDGSHK